MDRLVLPPPIFSYYLGLVRTHRPRAEGIVTHSFVGTFIKPFSLTSFPYILQHNDQKVFSSLSQFITTKYVCPNLDHFYGIMSLFVPDVASP